MTKTIYVIAVIALSLNISCKESTDGNKNVLQKETSIAGTVADSTISETTERYVGDDGTSALVTFKTTTEGKTISVRSNNKTIAAPLKETMGEAEVYGNFDFEMVAKNDSITITQGDNIITMRKAKGE